MVEVDGYRHIGTETMPEGVRRVVRLAAIFNLAYFGVEFAVAMAIGSASPFAGDFRADTSVNFLILLALNWSARKRARMRILLAARARSGYPLDGLAEAHSARVAFALASIANGSRCPYR